MKLRRIDRLLGSLPAILIIGVLTGCLRAKSPTGVPYIIKDQGELAFLIPPSVSINSHDSRQSVVVAIDDGPSKLSASAACSAQSALFELSPDKQHNHWRYSSPTASGWAAQSIDVHQDWKTFLHKLALLRQSNCFATTQDSFSIQRLLAAVTPLPADEVNAYFYSNDKDGFVDLAPGMQLLFQQVSPKRHRLDSQRFNVEQRNSGGVELREERFSPNRKDSDGAIASPSTSRLLVSKPLLRLFLEEASDVNAERKPVLLGAEDLQSLDAATAAIRTSGSRSCTHVQADVNCNLISDGSASLLIRVRVNRQREVYPLGTQLARILPQADEARLSQALSSVEVMRANADGGETRVTFPRTLDGAMQVLLRAGDRIRWNAAVR